MINAAPFIKWITVIALTTLVHVAIFQAQLANSAEESQLEDLMVIEINLDVVEDTAVVPSTQPAEEVEETDILAEEPPPEEETLPEQNPEILEKIEEEKRIEQERLEEERREEDKRLIEEQKRKEKETAEKKRQAEIVRKKVLEEQARKKETAAIAAAKRTQEAEAQRLKALAGKVAKVAYTQSRRKPVYPRALIRKGVEGIVRLRVNISVAGAVSNVSIHQSSGNGKLDKSALTAAKKWKYKPAFNGLGQTISSTKIETVAFQISR